MMRIDDTIIKSYLQDNEDYKKHWIFNSILEDGTYLFENPQPDKKEKVKRAYESIYGKLDNLKIYNSTLFDELFPQWIKLIKDLNIILAVGCPNPYDAMVREHNGSEYIIYDLIRFLNYEEMGHNLDNLILSLFTHEFAHICIHNEYKNSGYNYVERLKYIVFDEGFAHLLSFCDNIETYDFIKEDGLYYENLIKMLKEALLETDKAKQEEYINIAQTGRYWDKFGAISGKLYLAKHIKNIGDIYKQGPDELVKNMIMQIKNL